MASEKQRAAPRPARLEIRGRSKMGKDELRAAIAWAK
jgi:hypothetical protein